jgi:hypothetical protein
VQKPFRSPKSLSNGVPKQVRNSPGSSW